MAILEDLIEIRFHGRGGQGAVTAARLLAAAAYKSGLKGVQAFPFFGAERRGAPVTAFLRFSKERVRIHSMIYEPDAIVVLDDSLLEAVNVTQGLKEGGKIVINTSKSFDELPFEKGKYEVYKADCTSIALELGLVIAGIPVVNTAILGAVLKAFPEIKMEKMEEVIYENWSGELAKKNAEAIKKAYNAVEVM